MTRTRLATVVASILAVVLLGWAMHQFDLLDVVKRMHGIPVAGHPAT